MRFARLPFSLLIKRYRFYVLSGKGIRARIRHRKIHAGGLGGTEILIGTGILHLVEGIPEHLVVGLLPVQQEVDGLTHLLVTDLPV